MTSASKPPVQKPTMRHTIRRWDAEASKEEQDVLAREEPLEIRLRWGPKGDVRRLGLVMRTPGHDEELAVGLLWSEGVLRKRDDLRSTTFEPAKGEAQEFNSLLVELDPECRVEWDRVERPLVMTAACGVCGRAMLSHLRELAPKPRRGPALRLHPAVLSSLPDRLRRDQSIFEATGGLHAAAAFTADGAVGPIREDVGRHNAVDKLVGHLFLDGQVPVAKLGLLVSGRAGYEIVQKAVRAGFEAVVAVGAPSSLAVELAEEFGVTLVGFLRGPRFNVYAGASRVGA